MITSLYTVYMNGAHYKCKVTLYIMTQSIMTSHLKLLLKCSYIHYDLGENVDNFDLLPAPFPGIW